MSHKLLCRQTLRGKPWSVYIATHLKASFEVHKNISNLDNQICKVIMKKAIHLMSIWLKDPPMLLG